MQKIRISELFGPAGFWKYDSQNEEEPAEFVERFGVTQGEGKYVGKRSTFLRTYGCNFDCPSFGLPKGEKTTEPDEFAKTIHLYKSITELPIAKFGCDSWFSWHPSAKHLSPFITADILADQILKASGGTFFANEHSPIHLILTGGEPLLGWQRAYLDLIDQLRLQDPVWREKTWLKLPVTFETNGTQALLRNKTGTLAGVPYIHTMAASCDITWSVSAKLSVSGHTNEEAIKPEIVASYLEASKDMYLKFVVQEIGDFDEVDAVVKQFYDAGVRVPVYIMAEGGEPGEYAKHNTIELVSEAVKRGYDISPRLHVMIGDNAMSW
jgi:organic radical activating enzyme